MSPGIFFIFEITAFKVINTAVIFKLLTVKTYTTPNHQLQIIKKPYIRVCIV